MEDFEFIGKDECECESTVSCEAAYSIAVSTEGNEDDEPAFIFHSCQFASNGCKVRVFPFYYQDHLKHCGYGQTECIICKQGVMRRDMHLHMQSHSKDDRLVQLEQKVNELSLKLETLQKEVALSALNVPKEPFKKDSGNNTVNVIFSSNEFVGSNICDDQNRAKEVKISWGSQKTTPVPTIKTTNEITMKAISFSNADSGWNRTISIFIHSSLKDDVAVLENVCVCDSVWELKKKIMQKLGIHGNIKAIELSVNGRKMKDERMVAMYPDIVDGSALTLSLVFERSQKPCYLPNNFYF